MNVEADLIYLAAGFAERVAEGDWDTALIWAQSADAVSRGRVPVGGTPRGRVLGHHPSGALLPNPCPPR
jgi:hypothetical protein